ncbi:MAG: PIN domain-containing protein [Bacteroidota bacterium]|nr:PIN domain-containing protein [Bacteroidota bacterium]
MKKSTNDAVIDTNIVFSALLRHQSNLRDVILNTSLSFCAPNFIIAEIFSKKEKILKYSKLSETDFLICFNKIIENIRFISIETIQIENRYKAYEFCKKIDPNDTPFIALCLELEIPFWTGDKKLITGLKKLGFDNFFEIDNKVKK